MALTANQSEFNVCCSVILLYLKAFNKIIPVKVGISSNMILVSLNIFPCNKKIVQEAQTRTVFTTFLAYKHRYECEASSYNYKKCIPLQRILVILDWKRWILWKNNQVVLFLREISISISLVKYFTWHGTKTSRSFLVAKSPLTFSTAKQSRHIFTKILRKQSFLIFAYDILANHFLN